jgi:hypothetical protein
MLQITVGQAAGIIAAAIFIGMYPFLAPLRALRSTNLELKLGYGLQVALL